MCRCTPEDADRARSGKFLLSYYLISTWRDRDGGYASCETKDRTLSFPRSTPAALLTDGNRFLIAAAAECCLRTVQPSTSGGFRKRIISTPSPLSTVLPKCNTILLTFSFVRIRDVASRSSPTREHLSRWILWSIKIFTDRDKERLYVSSVPLISYLLS